MGITFEESIDAEAVGSDNDKPAGSGHALAIIAPTTLLRPAAASAMLVPKLIADADGHQSLPLSKCAYEADARFLADSGSLSSTTLCGK